MGVLKHAAACGGEPKLSHGGLFFFHNMSNLWTLCCTDISELDGSSVVYLPYPNSRGPGFHSWKWQFFADQFFSFVARIFAFLVLFCHVKS